jgi:proteasome lid subunit RPN8/RPN11
MLAHKIKQEILQHAKEDFPRECCGVLVEDRNETRYIRIKNISRSLNSFLMDMEQYDNIEKIYKVVSIVHSHTGLDSEPSVADKVSCAQSGLPWLIVCYPEGIETWLRPEEIKLPYEERTYVLGVVDTYTLVKDFYKCEFNIELPYPLHWLENNSYDLETWNQLGFYLVKAERERGDIQVIATRYPHVVPNHLAIYLDNGYIIHHPREKISGKIEYSKFWKINTLYTLRYKSTED